MSEDTFIISGPSDYAVKNESIGKYFIDCLRKRSKDEIINVDVVTGDTQTCGELLEDALKVVQILKGLGIKKDDVIAVINENSVRYNVPVLAALSMGVISILLNPDYTKRELRHALEIAKPKCIICNSKALQIIKDLKQELDFIQSVLIMGKVDENDTKEGTSLEKLLNAVTAINCFEYEPELLDAHNQGAVILLSSGTTGLPKGVLLTHQNLRLALCYMGDQRYCGLSSGDNLVFFVPVFHVFGLLLYLTTLSLGSKLLIFQKFQLRLFFNTIERYAIKKVQVVTPVLSVFADNTAKNYDLSSIEEISVGGSYVSKEAVNRVAQGLPGVRFRELYGSTEVSGGCSFLTKFPKKENCIGSLVSTCQAKVCDCDSGTTLKCMEVGELCFRGPMIMKGYIGIPNNKTIIDDDGFYHSGDAGYYDEEGNLYIVGRIKELIKYKAFQVSPAELELLLLTHTAVKDCAVIGKSDERAGQLPLAFIVRRPDCEVTEQEIVEFVAENISINKRLYGGVRFIDEIPKNLNGKILRRKLEELVENNLE